MTFETALAGRLLTPVAGPTNAAGRVDWNRRPQASALPAITIEGISDPRPQVMRKRQSTRPTRVQVTCWGATKAQAVAVREQAVREIEAARQFGGVTFQRAVELFVRALFDRQGDDEFYQEIIDVTLWHDD